MPHPYLLLPPVARHQIQRAAFRAKRMGLPLVGSLTLGLSLGWAPTVKGQALFQTNGSAAASASTSCSGGFAITPNTTFTQGSVWRLQQITLAKSFVFNFNVNLGTNDGNGSDGMTFALQRNATGVSALGGGSQNLGMSGITPSVLVEFDTYDNGTSVGDIAADHIAIAKNGQLGTPVMFTTPAGTPATAIAAAVDANGNALNIENGNYYPVKVAWNVNTKTLQVYFNNVLRATYSENFVATIFGSNPLVYWGFTAATGGFSNQMEACSLAFDYDQDTDGLTDAQDADDDNDGLADAVESKNVNATGDADNDGVLNYQDADFGLLNAKGVVASLDADGDGIINQFDLDSDSDGIPDVVEGTNGQMTAPFRNVYSAASGQYSSGVDAGGSPQNTSSYTTLPDTDADGTPDYLDTNSDGDAVVDWAEAFDDNSNGVSLDDFKARAAAFVAAGGSSAFYPGTDTGNQGMPDWLKDSNGNRIPNFLDITSTFYHDTDADGLVDLLDPSNLGKAYADVSGIPDRNSNGVSDYRDALVVTPLPVQLASFEARVAGNRALLLWATATELNNAYFVPEVSSDGLTFTAIGRVTGAGTSAQRHEYRFTDVDAFRYGSSVVYYRLRQVDQNGTAQYSAVRTVGVGEGSGNLVAQPNPFKSELVLELRGMLRGPATLVVLSATGQVRLVQPVAVTAGTTTLRVPQAASWPSGMYLVRVVQGGRQYTLKVVRE